jgi:acetyltransferase-like isoleucine patch superfamily enzyme
MSRQTKRSHVDNLLARVANRLEWTRVGSIRNDFRASIDPTATLHPTARIENLHGNAEAIAVGAHTHVRGELLTFWDGGKISIGEWCYIGEGSRIWSQASVSIGNHVMIAHSVDIHDTDSHPLNWQERRLDTQAILSGHYRSPTQTISKSIVIGDDAWIGLKATILKGVQIGRGAIVAAASVVTKDVAAWEIVAGNPARLVGMQEPAAD